ncbi:hypothetical protein DSCW_04050 [Desulfosarcina widdelii]|uniref:NodB homology domain-containing protein n=1 Tax=Desulfosarcina widdelii TaxID=947919 RepID=A0A5K7YWK0_9BACT|nr:hypothetical protein [Desulfosarcina widdelii]BBO72988.1 hypothetical protein DSCW_04050 [Desulfosarcina widdelii]
MRKKLLKLLPFPSGYEFAITFTDDTDFSTRENTEPVYNFLYKMKIKGTKTVWTTKQKRTSSFNKKNEKNVHANIKNGSTIQNQDYLDFILSLKQRNFEIALHNVAAGNSYRNEIIEGIERFKTTFGEYPKINIFHEKNMENLYAGYYKLNCLPFKVIEKVLHNSDYQGHIEGSPYFWGDIAMKNIKYMRIPFHTIKEINTLKINPTMPFYDPNRPYVNYWFSCSDGSCIHMFKKLLTKKNIDNLIRENGACIIYTHFSKGFAERVNKRYVLNDGFVNIIKRISKYNNAWFPTVSEFLDRLLIIKKVSVIQNKYDVRITNNNDFDVDSITLKVAPGFVLKDPKGKELKATKNGIIIIDNLKSNSTILFQSNEIGKYNKYLKNNFIPKSERATLEFYNYYGLLKSSIKL